jgi:hypothetical protein
LLYRAHPPVVYSRRLHARLMPSCSHTVDEIVIAKSNRLQREMCNLHCRRKENPFLPPPLLMLSSLFRVVTQNAGLLLLRRAVSQSGGIRLTYNCSSLMWIPDWNVFFLSI